MYFIDRRIVCGDYISQSPHDVRRIWAKSPHRGHVGGDTSAGWTWRDAYRFDRHGRRTWFTLLRGPALDERLVAFDRSPEGRGRALYAAFSAADVQAPAVRQPRTWLFAEAFGETALMHALEAKAVDTGENLVVLVADDPGVFYEPDVQAGRLACTNAVQTYVDLWHAGGRGTEAAEALLEQYLKRPWSRQ